MPNRTHLLPREHGAYAQLAFPLLTGLALARPSPGAVALALSAVAFFLANEPVAVLLGVRGGRLEASQGGRARIQARVLLAAGVLSGMAGLILGWPAVWPMVLFPVAPASILIPFALAGKQKTLLGEFLVLTAFSTLVLPLGAASGVEPMRAYGAAGVWWVSFALATLEVHAIKARLKGSGRNRWTRWGSPAAAAVVFVAVLLMALGQWGLPSWAGYAAALLPPSATVLALGIIWVHPRHLKQVGWTLVAVNSLTLLMVLQG